MGIASPAPYEVRCPLLGSIPFDERERGIIDHPLVQRLRAISQLGFASLVYPGATHSRFSHSLGVMHLAGSVFDKIFGSAPVLRDAGLSTEAVSYCRSVVRLAGLLHDLGHPPFSHAFEPLLPPRATLNLPRAWYAPGVADGQATHEDLSVAAIAALAEQCPHLLSAAQAQDICALVTARVRPTEALTGGGNRPNLYPLLKQIISGEVDADRMDYLRRDAHFAGVPYGLFDLSRLISALSCVETSDGLAMTLEHNAVYAYENFLMARFHMAMQVYFHKTLLPFEHFLARALAEGEIDLLLDGTPEALLAARDDTVMTRLYHARDKPWAGRIVHRKPVSRLLQLHEVEDLATRQRILETVRALQADGLPILHLKAERRLSTLGLEGGAAPIYVQKPELGRIRLSPLQHESELLERYNQLFTIESLYCDAEHYEDAAAALREVTRG